MTWYSRLPSLINLFFLLPLILKYFSIDQVALYYLFTSLIRYQDIADLGFGFSYTRYISYSFAGAKSLLNKDLNNSNRLEHPNWISINKLYNNMHVVYFYISLIFMLLVGSFTTIQIWDQLIFNSYKFLWFLFLFIVFLKIRYKYVESLIQGLQEVALLRRITGNLTLFQVLISVLIMILLKSFFLILLFNSFFMLVIILRNFYIKNQILKKYKILFNDCKLERDVFKEIVPLSIKSGFGNLVTNGLYNSSGFIYTNILSSNDLTVLLLCNKFINIIKDFSRAPFYSKIPELGKLYIKDINRFIKLSDIFRLRSILIYSVGVILFLSVINIFLVYMSNSISTIPKYYWILLSIAFLIERVSSMNIQLYTLSNKVNYHIINTITTFVVLMLMYINISKGLNSYPISLIIGFALVYMPLSFYFLIKNYGKIILGYNSLVYIIILILLLILV